MQTLIAGSLLSASLCCVAHPVTAKADVHFEVTRRYALQGAERWDYVAYDPVRHHLFVSRDDHVQVIDTHTGKLFGEIEHTDGAHGFAFVQDRKLGFVTNGRANTITVINLDTLKMVDTIQAAGPDPDGILYVPSLQRVYVSNGHDKSVSAIDVATRKIVATTQVGGKPEALVADGQGHVFVNVEDKSEIVEIDASSAEVLAQWPLAPCEEPSGLAIDATNERLFTVCANQHMMVVNAVSGHAVADLPIGGHPDAAAFDPALKLAFSSNGA
ncbi:YncE family protein, partial [Pararobbsia alpina]|uniref:YncE family protein n=1 Tax=Pararobbsia alpina TaxID=621374 RepID=UPI001583987A